MTLRRLLATQAPPATILIRVMVGSVFLPLTAIILTALATTKLPILAANLGATNLHDSGTQSGLRPRRRS
jgi:hypothetical protein